jgi:hypothetical protein
MSPSIRCPFHRPHRRSRRGPWVLQHLYILGQFKYLPPLRLFTCPS